MVDNIEPNIVHYTLLIEFLVHLHFGYTSIAVKKNFSDDSKI